jgi:hypothetical protein
VAFRAARRVACGLALSGFVFFARCGSLAGAGLDSVTQTETLATPQAAASFTGTLGMNVHLAYADSGYGKLAAVESLLTTLGVHHVRDAGTIGRTALCSTYRSLARAGIRTDFVASIDQDPRTFGQWLPCVSGALEAFEGPNEFNATGGDWAGRLRVYQQRLYQTLKSDPATAPFPVVAPSLTVSDAYRELGNIAADADVGNSHDYLIGHNPGVAGYCGADAAGRPRSWIECELADSRVTTGPKPVWATETGYGTGTSVYAIDPTVQAKYVPRLFLEHFNAGIVRTYEYELIDEGTDGYNGYGLVDAQLRPKPAFFALANLAHALSANQTATLGASRTATRAPKFPIVLREASRDVHHTLLEQDGVLLLILWLEVPSEDPSTHQTIAVAPQHVQMQFGSPPASITATSIAGRTTHPIPIKTARNVDLEVTDWPTVVAITPPKQR